MGVAISGSVRLERVLKFPHEGLSSEAHPSDNCVRPTLDGTQEGWNIP
jgi:hypothetical protein